MSLINTFLDLCKSKVQKVMTRVARLLNKITGGRLSPNAVTLVGLLAHFYIAYLIATAHPIRAAVLLVVFGLFDALDGALARTQGGNGSRGMLLDSITDRVKEIILYIGIGYLFVTSGHNHATIWAIAACGFSLLVSYINAWSDAVLADKKTTVHVVNASFRSGIMRFEMRIIALVIGLLSGYLLEAVAVVAVLSALTALSRFQEAWAKAK